MFKNYKLEVSKHETQRIRSRFVFMAAITGIFTPLYLFLPKCIFTAVCDVQKPIFVLLLFINRRHQCSYSTQVISHLFVVYMCRLPVGGKTLLMKMKMAFSGLNLIRFRMT